MENFVTVMFWLFVITEILRIICLGFIDYPRKITRGQDVVSFFVSLIFIIWAGSLIFG